MKTTRKIIIGLLVAAGLATAGAYAQPEGYWQGGGGFAFNAQDRVAMGPGMMGSGSGPRGGYGPGMAGPGADPRNGYGPGMAGRRGGQGRNAGAYPETPRNERNYAPN